MSYGGLTAEFAYSQEEDDLGPASPLENSSDDSPTPAEIGSRKKGRQPGNDQVEQLFTYRGYLDVEANQYTHTDGSQKRQAPNWEGNFAFTLFPEAKLQGFSDITGFDGHDDGVAPTGKVNQLGLRYRPLDKLVLTLGKERNRRSPGLVFSPSEILHPSQQAPGLREDRTGLWLARLSYQIPILTVDLIALPVKQMRDNGFPDKDSSPKGAVLRGYIQKSGVEISGSVGLIDKELQSGAYAQGFLVKSLKLYSEWGYREKQRLLNRPIADFQSWLVGWSFEGIDKLQLRMEYLSQPYGLTPKDISLNQASFSTPFVGRQFAIASIGAVDLFNRLSLYATIIKSLDEPSYLGVSHLDVTLSDRLTTGVTYIGFAQTKVGFASLRPFNEIASMDLKWSF
jgi:hypothetical protein